MLLKILKLQNLHIEAAQKAQSAQPTAHNKEHRSVHDQYGKQCKIAALKGRCQVSGKGKHNI